ncbi:MAG: hypothetical protein JXD19_12855 [Deltaproteobacteria bacterium]|nr:hypothetical protein [Deltaproteobacteria bacterium]
MTEGKPAVTGAGTPGGSQGNSVPAGSTARTKIERGDRYSAPEIYNLEITVLGSLRGEGALARIRAEGVSDRQAKPGYEYLLVLIRFGYFSKGRGFVHSGDPYVIKQDFLNAVSPDRTKYYDLPVLDKQLNPSIIDTALAPGQTREGWIVLQVPEDVKNPLISFKREYRENSYGIWKPIWFAV